MEIVEKIKEMCIYRFKNKIIENIINLPANNFSINISKTKKVKYEEVFTYMIRGKRLVEKNRKKGSIPYISAKESDNGIWGYISNPLFIESNAIVYTTFGDAFYIEGEFTTSDEVSVFKNEKLNIFSAMYIINKMQKNKHKYSYINKAFKNKWIEDFIELPILDCGEIDWNLMENYVKSLPYSINLKGE